MNYQELKAKATAGPLSVQGQCTILAPTGWKKTDKWVLGASETRHIASTDENHLSHDEQVANAALLAHCFNNFDDLLRIATHYVERMKCEHPVSQWEDEGIEIAEEILVRCREVKT